MEDTTKRSFYGIEVFSKDHNVHIQMGMLGVKATMAGVRMVPLMLAPNKTGMIIAVENTDKLEELKKLFSNYVNQMSAIEVNVEVTFRDSVDLTDEEAVNITNEEYGELYNVSNL